MKVLYQVKIMPHNKMAPYFLIIGKSCLLETEPLMTTLTSYNHDHRALPAHGVETLAHLDA